VEDEKMINKQNYEPSQNGKFRKRRVNFAQVSNIALRDNNLSLKAKGLYSLIQSYISMDDFTLYKWYLMSQCKEKERAFNNAWNELKINGYLKQYRIRSAEAGSFIYEYELLDEPNLEQPALLNIGIDGQIIEASEEDESIEEADQDPELDDEESYPPQNVGGTNSESYQVQNVGGTKETGYTFNTVQNRGLYNNTDFNNIKNNNTGEKNTQSVSQSGDGLQHIGQTDVLNYFSQKIKNEDPKIQDETMEEIKERIEYDYFVRWRPEYLTLVDTLVDYMVEMVTAPYTKINGVMHSRESLKRYVDKVNSCTINSFIDHMKGKELRGIVNPIAYWRTAFINLIKEIELECATI